MIEILLFCILITLLGWWSPVGWIAGIIAIIMIAVNFPKQFFGFIAFVIIAFVITLLGWWSSIGWIAGIIVTIMIAIEFHKQFFGFIAFVIIAFVIIAGLLSLLE